jgi:uncharacterized protein (TIGR03083 family)
VDYSDSFSVITTNAAALAAVARDAALLTATVPSCPEWDLAKLVRHTGTAHRWSAGVVRTREPLSPKSIDLEIPEDATGLPDWLERSAAGLVEELEAANPDAECWTWTAGGQVRFWGRRMAFETAVHRWDGQGVVSTADPFDGALAVDGIDEHLENLPFVVGAEAVTGTGESIHLHCTDRDGEWLLRLTPGGLEVTPEHAKGDAAIRGSASDLYLFTLGRTPAQPLDIFGPPESLERWAQILHF